MKSLLRIIDLNWYITQVIIPNSLSSIFTDKHFANYPKVLVPQNFIDDRGSIKNIALVGAIYDVKSGKLTKI